MESKSLASLELSNVSKFFSSSVAVDDISISIAHGEFAVFVGPSGCGKSTLLRLIAGLDTVSAGKVSIGGADVTPLQAGERDVAMVFQSYALYPHMSVFENIAFPLQMERRPKAEIRAEVEKAAAIVQLGTRLDDRPAKLSGGQRQRVAIARAIVRRPAIFLMDEPLSNLDAALRLEMRTELTDLHRRLGNTMVYVTHDQQEAMTMADRIVVLNGGRVEQVGRPMELYHRPANSFVAGFIGSPPMNMFPVAALPLQSLGGVATLGFRPEALVLDQPAGEAALRLEVMPHAVERLGLHTIVHATFAGHPVTALLPGDPEIAGDVALTLFVPERQMHFFDSEGRTRAALP